MLAMREKWGEIYHSRIKKLGEEGLHQILNAGRKWDLSEGLKNGGAAIFPHAYIDQCGDQIASVVHGCLDSGADQVLVLGVIHTLNNKRLKQARIAEVHEEKILDETFRGIFPSFEGEFSLINFKTLWEMETKRRGVKPPKLIERYPCLVSGAPERLLGIEELENIAKDAVIVLTGDLVHNGKAYQTQPQFEKGKKGEIFARKKIHEGLDLLNGKNYGKFLRHCANSICDARDVLTVLRYLRGPMKAEILDLRLIDTHELFLNQPTPSWVAASLVLLE